jgi:hypothetical protein
MVINKFLRFRRIRHIASPPHANTRSANHRAQSTIPADATAPIRRIIATVHERPAPKCNNQPNIHD